MASRIEEFDEKILACAKEEFLEKEEGITAMVASYVDEHLELFAKIV